MKQFLRNISISRILVAALIIRLVLIPLAFHSDLTTNTIWGIYAEEFGLKGYYDWLNFGNYARPEYPPISTILFLAVRGLWLRLFDVIWFVNVKIPAFPSNLMTWYDTLGNQALLKLPGIISDIGIGYLIYKYTKKVKYAVFYLFNPAVIYLSSVWGQTESFVAFFGLLGIIKFLEKKYYSGFWSLFVSFLTKASLLPSFPVILIQAVKEKMKLKEIVMLAVFALAGVFLVGSIFTDGSAVTWMIESYRTKFMVGPFNLPYINLNAFNFWGLILGLDRISDKTEFLGIAYSLWAWIIAGSFFAVILNKFRDKKTNIFFALTLVFTASFLFLPRMHERYLFPAFVFFPILVAKFPKLARAFVLLSAVFLINLYHWWWIPAIPPLMAFFDLELVVRGLSAVNLSVFGYLLWKYQLS